MSPKLRAWLIWSAVAAQVILIALAIFFDALSAGTHLGWDFVAAQFAARVIGVLVFPAVGAIIYSQRSNHPIGWLFCVLNLGWAINNFAGSYVKYALSAGKASMPAVDLMIWLYTWPGNISAGLLIMSVLLFPNGTLLSRRWRPVAWLVMGVAMAGAVATAFTPGPIDQSVGAEATNPLGLPGSAGELLSQFASVLLVLLLLLFVVAAISTVLRLRRSTGQERQQLKWFASGFALESTIIVLFVVVVTIYGSTEVMPVWAQVVGQAAILGTTIVPITAGIAVLKYRLYDIDLIINRTLVYVPLTGILAGLYSASIAVLQKLFIALTGEKSDAAIVLTTLVLASTFTPIKNALQAFVDRRFKEAHDPTKKLKAFDKQVQSVEQVIDTKQITVRLLEEAIEAFGASAGAIYLHEDGDTRLVCASEKWAGKSEIDIALESGGARIGSLVLSSQVDGSDYKQQDLQLLQQVADRVAHVILLQDRAPTRLELSGSSR